MNNYDFTFLINLYKVYMEGQIWTYILIMQIALVLYAFSAYWFVEDPEYSSKMSPSVIQFLTVSWKICISIASIVWFLTSGLTPGDYGNHSL